jgi:hypothetical protein
MHYLAYLPTFTDCSKYSGKIVSLSITPVSSEADANKSASVTFEKEA